jgi:hypothetical protein
MLNVFILNADGRVSVDHDHRTLAAALKDPGCVFWVDMDQPTDEELVPAR